MADPHPFRQNLIHDWGVEISLGTGVTFLAGTVTTPL